MIVVCFSFVATASGPSVSTTALARCVDLSLLHSGESVAIDDLVEVARWGHFENADRPWERVRRI